MIYTIVVGFFFVLFYCIHLIGLIIIYFLFSIYNYSVTFTHTYTLILNNILTIGKSTCVCTYIHIYMYVLYLHTCEQKNTLKKYQSFNLKTFVQVK